jgi:purine catabolism regulator
VVTLWYTKLMSLDLAAVVRAVGGEFVSHGFSERMPVDGVTPVAEYVVVGNPAFATLVTGQVHDLIAHLRSGTARAQVLARAVYVTPEQSQELRDLLATHQMSAILGTPHPGRALHAQLDALIAKNQAADDRLVTTGTKVLTQVARRGGAPAVITELAHRIDGWAVLLDPEGQLITSAGAGRLHVHDAVAVAFGRPVRVRHQGLQTHQVGSDRELVGYLVIASRTSVTSRTRDLASHAAALFDLVLRTRDPSVTEHLGRQALLETLHQGGDTATELLARWGVRDEHLTAFELGSRTRTIDLERLVTRWCDELGVEHLFAVTHARIRGFVPDDLVDALEDRAESAEPIGGGRVHLGLGKSAPIHALERSATQARQACDVALESAQTAVRFADLSTVGLVLDSLERDSTQQLSGALDELRTPTGDHGELTETLQVFLSQHGAHRSSATQLGIHRQTLVARIRRIEELTGLSMESADDRAAAWLALRALGR